MGPEVDGAGLNINSPDIYMKIPAHKIFNYRYEVSVSSILHNHRDDSSLDARTQFVQAILSLRPKLTVFLSPSSFYFLILFLFSHTFIGQLRPSDTGVPKLTSARVHTCISKYHTRSFSDLAT